MAATNDRLPAGNTRYALASILPAMHIPNPLNCGPVIFCTTKELDRYPLNRPEEARSVSQVAQQFRDAYGNSLDRLGLVLVPTDRNAECAKDGLPRMCRDSVALCHITAGTKMNCRHGQPTTICNSDYFEALPIRFRPQGYVLQRPGKTSLASDPNLDHLHPTLPVYLGGVPRQSAFTVDEALLRAFDRAATMYLRKKQRKPLRQVFRAVALTMHATRILPETDSTYYDLGSRITSWVAAFETLVHPGPGRVGLQDVLALIRRLDWQDAPARRVKPRPKRTISLKDQRYKIPSKNGPSERENAPCHLYRRLYDLRNDLAHGNVLRPREFAARRGQARGPRIDELAPLLFRECVLQRLRQLGILRGLRQGPMTHKVLSEYLQNRDDASSYHQALAIAL